MSTTDLLKRLRAARIRLGVRDGKLSVNAPKGALTDELRTLLQANKAELIELLSRSATTAHIPRADRSKPLPLSYAQQRIWFLEEFERGSSVYNIPWAMKVRGALDAQALQSAVDDLCARHESLRTTFRKTDEQPLQVVHAELPVALERVSLPGATEAEIRARVERWARLPFDLVAGPLLRVGLIETGRDERVLTIVIHHIVSDGWSLDVLQNELFAFYAARVAGKPLQPEALPLQLADYAVWQRSQAGSAELEQQLGYWRHQLRGAPPVLELPTDRPRPGEQSYAGSHVRRQLSGDLSRELRDMASERNVTLFMLLLAAFQALLARYSGQDDIIVGTPVAGRQRTELEGLIGLFLNTLAIRADTSDDPSFATLVERTRDTALDAFANQDLPFDRIVDALKVPRDLSHSPLYQVQFILQNTGGGGQPLDGLQFVPLEFDYGTAKFDLTLAIAETGRGLAAEAEYCTDLFDRHTIERLLAHFETLLRGAIANPDLPVSRLPLLDDSERRHLLTDLNDTAVSYPPEATLQSLLERQAAATPDAAALVFGDTELSYAELNARSNRLANWLRSQGARPDDMIGVHMQRSIDMVVALLGIVKAGAAYVPLDPEYPEQRLSHMLEDARMPVVLTQRAVCAALPASDARVVVIDELELAGESPANPPMAAGPRNLAYVIFTSGSTGRPKGVMNEHRGIVNRLLWMQDEYGLEAGDRVLQKTPFSFDVSVWEFFWPLLTGATLVVARPGGHRDSEYLCATIRDQRITTLHFVPSMLQVFLQNPAARQCGSLRRVICSGEALSHDLQTRFYLTLDAGLHNLYGPTEAAIDVTYWACRRDSRETTVPIGRPVANTHIYIVEPNGEPAPPGVAGELWIGGAQVARGYAGRPDLTAERFIPDPFAAAPEARVYRTGDLARYRSDGAIEFLGRIDHQVKLRGFRIELGEIEAVLDGMDSVEQSLVMLREDVPGNPQLVAYLTAATATAPDAPALREALKARVPEYMVPAAFVILDEFPLLPNGKADRGALPAPDGSRDVGSEYVPPGTPAEKALVAIWADLLRVDRVGIHDNFFELGGDSILSIQIIARAAREGMHLQPKQVFRYQTVAELAAVAATGSTVRAEQSAVTGTAPLTPVQHWFFAQGDTAVAHFNQSIRLRLRDELPIALLEAAFAALAEHHDALRLRFTRDGTRWRQEFSAVLPQQFLTELDTGAASADVREQRISGAAAALQSGFDLGSGKLLAGLLCRSDDAAAELIIAVHHLAMDGLSWRILLEDLETACRQLLAGNSVSLPAKTSSFRDWAEKLNEYAHGAELATERDWWLRQDWPTAPVPADHPDGANTIGSSTRAGLQLDASTTRKLLQDAPAAYHTRINDLLLAAFAIAWQEWSGQDGVLIDLEGHGREELFPELDVSRTLGWFTSIYPVALRCGANEPEGDVIKRTKEVLRGIPNNGLGYGVLASLAQPPLTAVPQPGVMFNYLGQFDQAFDTQTLFAMADGDRGPEQGPERLRSHRLEVNGGIYDGCLNFSLNFSTNVFATASVEALATAYERALVAVISHCAGGRDLGYTPSDFALAGLDQAQLDALLEQHPDTTDIYPVTAMQHGMLFHSLFLDAGAGHLSQVYLTQVVWELQGDMNTGAFRDAWQQVVDRHAVFRTSYHQNGYAVPLAVVHRHVDVTLHTEDWRDLDDAARERRLRALVEHDREQSFDLQHAPLMRLFLFRCAERRYRFLWSHHHAIMDGWSIPVVLDELFAAYEAGCAANQPALGPVRDYREYIGWLQQQDAAAAESYWRQTLAGFDAPTPLPGAMREYRNAATAGNYARHYFTLTEAETGALRETARKLRLTVNTLAQGMWSLLLARYTGEADVLFGATTSGRPAELRHVEDMVGLFLNTIPVRHHVEPAAQARDWFAQLQDSQLGARAHEYAALTDIQGWSDVPRGTPLFHTLLIFENYPDVSSLWEDRNSLQVTDMQALGWTSFPLSAAVSVSRQLILRLAYDTGYYDAPGVERLARLYGDSIRALLDNPDITVRELLQIPAATAATPSPRPDNDYEALPVTALDGSLASRFEFVAARHPEAAAIRMTTETVRYGELNRRANGIARALIDAGCEPGSRAGLVLGHDALMAAGLLGALKAGLVYVPLDPAAPIARLRHILADAGIDVLLHAPEYAAFAGELAAPEALTCIDAALPEPCDANPALGVAPDALAYILFTSGSTGTPKGVMQTQRNVLHHIRTYVDALHISRDDCLSLFSPYGFDAAVMDIYGALLTGACLCPLDMKRVESAADVLDALPALGITVFHSTPTVYRFLFEQSNGHDYSRIRLVVLGGEEARPGDLRLFQTHCRKDAVFVNGLGPTESTLALQYFAGHDTPVPAQALPVGTAVAGTEVLLLDEDGVAAGLSGEICLRSPYVTPGYWNAAELTDAAFSVDSAGQRIYHTGDLGRYNVDGQLVFIGRRDTQIKVRGHRIEPGEIEVAITAHEAVDRCVVTLMEDASGSSQLTAYCVPAGQSPIAAADLREHVRRRLPDYMVPAAFVAVDAIPLTANGKLDRRALPQPQFDSNDQGYVAPRNEVEAQVAAIWREVLNVERVGVEDDFFLLGGHSLLATRLMSRLREALQVELPLRALFDAPTVAGLCAEFAGAAAGDPARIPPREPGVPVPLSYTQQRLWFLDQLEPGSSVYNLSWATRLRGGLNTRALQQALDDLIARHEVLRTHFVARDGAALQVIADELALPLQRAEFAGDTEALQGHLRTLAREPFDLAAGPLLRAHLLHTGPDHHVLLLTIHHIISDNWSNAILMRDLQALYTAHAGGTEPDACLPALPVQFADYALWQRNWLSGAELQRQLDYWSAALAAAPTTLDLPTDRTRPAVASTSGARVGWRLPRETSRRLQQLANDQGSTLFMVLIAAYGMLLGRYAGQDDVLIGTPVAGRKHSDLEELIGFFVNTLVIRARPQAQLSFCDYLREVRATCLDAFAHQDLPFEKLVEELQPERDLSRSPLFQAAFILQNAPQAAAEFADLEIDNVTVEHGNAKFELTLGLWQDADGIGGSCEYNSDLFERTTIERMLQHYTVLLEAVAKDAAQSLAAIPLLTDAEHRQIVVDWNDTALDYEPATLHALFEHCAVDTPEAIAIWTPATTLSYRELNRRANKLAVELIARGVGPEVLVGVCCERRCELIVALMAVLKAGGAYVPLDPAYPPQRVAYMLDDSNAKVLLTLATLLPQLPESGAETLCLDEFDWTTGADFDSAPSTAVSDSNLAYTIYTSGSTGLPKGVMIEHRNAVALAEFTRREYRPAELNGVLASTSVCFDLSVWEIFCTLGLGGRIVLVENALALPALPAEADVRLINTVPSAMAELVRIRSLPPTLTTVNLAGEPLSTRLVDAIYASAGVQRVYDLYGPSEDTTYSTWTLRVAGEPPTIGRPLHNTQAYIVDAGLQPLPAGIPGELLLGGAGVTRGYLGRPELTAEKYIANPFGDGRLYRTGDKARFRADGNIEFLGRLDHQVKLRGFRIELGEIEACAEQLAAVREAVALVREDTPGDPRLVLYLVAEATDRFDSEAVRQHLQAFLPAYMVPAALVALEALPQTPNGKLDRKALPAPEQTAAGEYVAPRNETEEMLADIWCATLGIERVGIHDDFFRLGGHSLLAAQVTARVRETLQTDLPLRALFDAPTIAGLAPRIAGAGDDALPRVLPRSPDPAPPLSFAQQRQWVLAELDRDSAAYNIPVAIRLDGDLDRAALQTAIDELVRRHESLRTCFAQADGAPHQVITDDLRVEVRHADIEPAALETRLRELASTRIDLRRGPLLEVTCLHTGTDTRVLLLVIHHIIADQWSLGILLREIAELYNASVESRPAALPPLPVQYADFAVWQNAWLDAERMATELDYWQQTLAHAPPAIGLATDFPRPPHQTFRGAHVRAEIPPDTAAALRELATASGCTLFMVMLAAFNTLLARYSGDDDIVVGTPVSGRRQIELESVVGMFLNTLAVRTDLSGEIGFRDLLSRVRGTLLDAYSHQDLPFERLVEALQPERDPSRTPLFQVLFTMQQVADDPLPMTGLTTSGASFDFDIAKFDISLFVANSANGLALDFSYNTDLYERQTLERMAGHMLTLLRAVTEQPDQPVLRLPLQAPATASGHATARPAPEWQPVHVAVEAIAAAMPSAPAVEAGERRLSYAGLNARANRLARHLRSLGAAPGQYVAICAERSLEQVTAVLAVLKSGAAYVPVDPAYPAERVTAMLDDAAPCVVLADAALSPDAGRPVVRLDEFDWQHGDGSNLADTGADSAYVIYTSGSTGKPKGVELTHAGLHNLIAWQLRQAGLDTPAVTLQFASLSFDVSFQELFSTWSQGGRLVLVDADVRRDMPQLAQLIRRAGVERLFLPFAALQPLAEELARDTSRLRISDIVVAGEQLQVTPAVRSLFSGLGSDARLHNHYGPTETHVVTAYTMSGNPDSWPSLPPIGATVANTVAHVLDRYGQPVPDGVPGELHISGVQVAKGYLRRPELSAEKFRADPLLPGARRYATGDRVRVANDGNLQYLGRCDEQVKWRGFRIEPGEIESLLTAQPSVSLAAVVLREDSPGDRRLVAYVSGDNPDSAELEAHLRTRLPDYMVPSLIVCLQTMPLTPSGKVARRLLPVPDYTTAGDSYVAPRNDVERRLADIWSAVLRIDRVGVNDDFFRLGGHSLLATQVVSRVRERIDGGVELRQLFDAPTIAAFAATLNPDVVTGLSHIPAVDHAAGAPLSFAQQRLWFLDQMGSADAAVYNIPGAVRLRGGLDVNALQKAIDALVQRHESLRTVFADTDDEPCQRLRDTRHVELQREDLRGVDEATLRARIGTLAARDFALDNDPLLRVWLLQLGTDDHVLLIVMHHIISDGWSIDVLNGELAELYAAAVEGRPAELPELPIQYADFAIWQREALAGELLERQVGYWRERLAGAPAAIELPTDRPRPAVQTYAGTCHRHFIPAARLDALKRLAGEESATLFMALLGVYSALLARWAGQDDIVVGSPIAGRQRTETEHLIGFFVNTLALRSDLSGAPDFRELLRRMRNSTLSAYDHQDVPFEKIVEELQPPRNLSYTPLFQVMFVLQQPLGEGARFAGLEASGVDFDLTTTKFDLTLSAQETADGLIAGFTYNTDLFDPATIARLAQQFDTLIDRVCAAPDMPVAAQNILDPAERDTLLHTWNATARDYPSESSIQGCFEARAEQSPDATAVRCDGRTLSYRELNRRANRLAHYLRANGVAEETLVALSLDRSIEAVVTVLAILKAGGAYVPLDPAYPAGRLQFMLEDTASPLLLTQSDINPELDTGTSRRVDLDRLENELDELPDTNPVTAVNGRSLAYVIYTSGSTGTPKGTLIEHRSVLRLVINNTFAPLDDGLRIGMIAPISFDASTLELWGTLLCGGECVVFPQRTPGINELSRFFADNRIDLLFITTTLFNSIVDSDVGLLQGIRYILTGGEAMSSAHIRRAVEALPDTRYSNVYGPTESTTFATSYSVSADSVAGRTIPIGKPIANTTVYVLDEYLNAVPAGVAGELYIGGDGLACGYLNRPELTAERFVSNPFADDPDARLYRTGDRVRYLADGNIEFMGRADDQVKLRGFRIEPGEIEAALREHPAVNNAAAVVTELAPGDRRLVAYAAVREPDTGLEDRLLEFVSERLPSYMVPSAVMLLSEIPQTANGKLDRSALPAPQWSSQETYTAPRNDRERQLCLIWAEVLQAETIGVHDDFFVLGGHSLLTIRLIRQIEKATGQRLEVAAVFENPTVAGLARLLEAGDSGSAGKQPAAATSPLLPIRTSGSRPPLFCIHGEPMKMARELDDEQPLYGIYNAYDPAFRAPASLEALATLYLNEMRKVQPHGPYHIVGYCVGGLAAFEMARQLVAAGEQVAYLALIDPTNPGRAFTRREWVRSAFAVKGQRLQAAAFFARRAVRSVLARLHTGSRLLRAYGYEWLGREMPFNLRQVRHTGAIKDAFRDYRYAPAPLAGTIFRPDLSRDEVAELEHYWSEIFTEGATFVPVAGLTNHFQFMAEPFHSRVSAMIGEELKAAAAAKAEQDQREP